jgi:hypothetical protein
VVVSDEVVVDSDGVVVDSGGVVVASLVGVVCVVGVNTVVGATESVVTASVVGVMVPLVVVTASVVDVESLVGSASEVVEGPAVVGEEVGRAGREPCPAVVGGSEGSAGREPPLPPPLHAAAADAVTIRITAPPRPSLTLLGPTRAYGKFRLKSPTSGRSTLRDESRSVCDRVLSGTPDCFPAGE